MVDLVLHTGHTSKHFKISHSVHIASYMSAITKQNIGWFS